MLDRSLNDLQEALQWAKAEDSAIPPQRIIERAREILADIHDKVPRKYAVYLMPDGAIAIDTRGVGTDGALIVLHIDGTVCSSGEKDSRFWHIDRTGCNPMDDPDLLKELRELGNPVE